MDSDDFSSPRHFPVRCQACGALKGYPICVQTIRLKPGHIRIEICCHACKEQWFQEVDTESQ